MCHETLTNEMDALVNECALSYILFKETVHPKKKMMSLFIHYPTHYFKYNDLQNDKQFIWLTHHPIQSLLKPHYSFVLEINQTYVNTLQPNDNHSLHWTVNCYNWITNYSKICCEQNQLIIQKTQKSKFEKESGIGIFSTKAGQDCHWVAIKMLNYYSHIHYHMASKDTDHFI